MERFGEELPKNLVDSLFQFISDEIDKGNIDPKQKIGFSILSQGFLSINIWGRGNVLFSQTYTVEGTEPNLSSKLLDRTGVACTWEAQIMGHEYRIWHEYLLTPQLSLDKKSYLGTFIQGDLAPSVNDASAHLLVQVI